MHSWSGLHGVPDGLERWQHGSYRWASRPRSRSAGRADRHPGADVLESVAGALLMALGLLLLLVRLLRPLHLRHPLLDGLGFGGLLGWLVGRRWHR
jgi:hypothetical protein